MTIFEKLPSEAYNSTNDRLVKAHQVKVTNKAGEAKIVDLVDLRLSAGYWQDITKEGLIIEGTDGPINDFKFIYKILDSLHRAGSTWEEIKASLYDAKEAWI